MPNLMIAETVLDQSTLINLGTAAAVLAPIGAAFLWLQARLARIDRRLERIEDATCWRVEDQVVWTAQLSRANPNLSVPEVRKVGPLRRIEDEA